MNSQPKMNKRALGIDLGSKRIGIAICDSGGLLATPLMVLARSGDKKRDHEAIRKLAEEEEVGYLVVGLPRDLSGRNAIAARNVLDEVAELATVVPVPIETYDERMTTALVAKALRGNKRAKANIDAAAAASILQSWLDSRL